MITFSLTMAAPSATAFTILPQTPQQAHAHESFSAARQLEEKLRLVVRGEVRFDQASRALYATDASNYRQVPIGLVLPRDEADVVATVACSAHDLVLWSTQRATWEDLDVTATGRADAIAAARRLHIF